MCPGLQHAVWCLTRRSGCAAGPRWGAAPATGTRGTTARSAAQQCPTLPNVRAVDADRSGEDLIAWRRARGRPRAALAVALSVSRDVLRTWEAGSRPYAPAAAMDATIATTAAMPIAGGKPFPYYRSARMPAVLP